MNKIIPMYSKLTENRYSFVFFTDRPLTHEEKMKLSSKGLNALKKTLEKELGTLADHDMSFGFEDYDED